MLNNKLHFVIISFIVLLFVSSCSTKSTESDNEYMDISSMEALALINNNPELIVIDVSPVWADGHLPGALNFQWGNGDFAAAVPGWDNNAKYLIYCHGDAPAIAAAQHLIDEGFYNVYRLEGNYSAWVDAGYPVEVGP